MVNGLPYSLVSTQVRHPAHDHLTASNFGYFSFVFLSLCLSRPMPSIPEMSASFDRCGLKSKSKGEGIRAPISLSSYLSLCLSI